MSAGANTLKGDVGLLGRLRSRAKQGFEVGFTEKAKTQRNRAYLLILLLIGLLVFSWAIIFSLAESRVVVPVITVIGANNRVVEQSIVGHESINAREAVVEEKINDFITHCNTFSPPNRQYLSDLCRLHSTPSVAAQYDAEIGPNNPNNPYLDLGENGQRVPRITDVTKFAEDGYRVEWESIVKRPGAEERIEYFSAIVRFVITKKPLKLGDRWVNGVGYATKSYVKTQALARN